MSKWGGVSESTLEELVFELIRRDPAYQGTEWLYPYANADRRDISAKRMETGNDGRSLERRMIIQCRNPVSREVSFDDLMLAVQQVALWRDPPFDIHTLITTGCFSEEANRLASAHNAGSRMPSIRLVSGSDLRRSVLVHSDLSQIPEWSQLTEAIEPADVVPVRTSRAFGPIVSAAAAKLAPL